MSKYSDLCGWVHRPQAIEKALKSLPFPTFGAIKLIKGSGRGKEVLLHRIVTDVIGYYPIFSQQIGDCVSMSAAGSATALQAIEVRVDGNEEFGGIIATEPIYADSRVAIGQGQLGYEDGSVSAWACQAMQKYGTVVRQNYPDVGVDLTNYNPNYSKTWGSPNKGTPKGLWDISRKHTIVTFSQIGSYEEAIDALASGYPITFGAQAGFDGYQDSNGIVLRDVNGFAKRGTPWGHSQYMLSFCDTGSHPGILVVNSWSEKWIKGPKKYPDQPEGTYFITPEDANFIFRQGDAWAISSYNGFPIRSLNLRIV